MRSVNITLRKADLSREMEAMREWLDFSGYAPRKFNCDQDGDAVVVSVEFMVEEEGQAFEAHFAGDRLVPTAK